MKCQLMKIGTSFKRVARAKKLFFLSKFSKKARKFYQDRVLINFYTFASFGAV